MTRSRFSPSHAPAGARNLLAAAAIAVLITACGSSASSSPKPHPAKPGARATAATVATAKVPGYGQVLATGKGQPLFLFTADPSGASKCTGSCASAWPPLTVSGKPTAGSGVKASLLSTFKRSNGQTQVLYNGHALYTHPGSSPGSYAGMAADGGIWYLVSTAGAAIKSTKGGGY